MRGSCVFVNRTRIHNAVVVHCMKLRDRLSLPMAAKQRSHKRTCARVTHKQLPRGRTEHGQCDSMQTLHVRGQAARHGCHERGA